MVRLSQELLEVLLSRAPLTDVKERNEKNWSGRADDFRTFLENGRSFVLVLKVSC
jgi:hypothetical protein